MDLLQETQDQITGQDEEARAAAENRLSHLTMPHWALGRVMDLAVDLAGITGQSHPSVNRKQIITCAGDHGVVDEGVSQYPQEVTPQMVANFLEGGAGINAMARVAGAAVLIVNAGVAADLSHLGATPGFLNTPVRRGTDNIAEGPATSPEHAIAAVELGIRTVLDSSEAIDVFGTGDMGIGNTTPSAAIAAVLTSASPETVTGRGTGIDDERFANKVRVIQRAIETNQPDPTDGIDVLAKVGGLEIGAIAGVILGSARCRKPVVIDGYISGAGALIAQALCPASTDHLIAAHISEEPGHRVILERLGKKPLLDLGLRLGEGTGAALAMPILDAATRLLTDVSTFDEASVSGPEGASS